MTTQTNEVIKTFSATVSHERKELRALVDFLRTAQVNPMTYSFLRNELNAIEERLQAAQAKFDFHHGI